MTVTPLTPGGMKIERDLLQDVTLMNKHGLNHSIFLAKAGSGYVVVIGVVVE